MEEVCQNLCFFVNQATYNMTKIAPHVSNSRGDELDEMIQNIWDSAKAAKVAKVEASGILRDFCFISDSEIVSLTERGLFKCWVDDEGELASERMLETIDVSRVTEVIKGGENHIICYSDQGGEKSITVYDLKGNRSRLHEPISLDGQIYSYTSAFAIATIYGAEIYTFNQKLSERRGDFKPATLNDVVEIGNQLLHFSTTANKVEVSDLIKRAVVCTIQCQFQVLQLATRRSGFKLELFLGFQEGVIHCYNLEKVHDSWVQSHKYQSFNYWSVAEGLRTIALTPIDDDKLAVQLGDSSVILLNVTGIRCDPERIPAVFPTSRKLHLSRNGTIAADISGIAMKKLHRVHWKQTLPIEISERLRTVNKMHLTTSRSKLIVSGSTAEGLERVWIWTLRDDNTLCNPPKIFTAEVNQKISFEVSVNDENLVLFQVYDTLTNHVDLLPVNLTAWCLYDWTRTESSGMLSLCFFPRTLSIAIARDKLLFARIGDFNLAHRQIKFPNEEVPTVLCEGCSNSEGDDFIQEVFVGCYDEKGEEAKKHSILAVKLKFGQHHIFPKRLCSPDYQDGQPIPVTRLIEEVEPVSRSKNQRILALHEQSFEYMYGHSGKINMICTSKDQTWLMSSSETREIILWRLWEGYRIRVHKVIVPSTVRCFTAKQDKPLVHHIRDEEAAEFRQPLSVGEKYANPSLPEKIVIAANHLVVLTQSKVLTVWSLDTWACMGSRVNVQAIDVARTNSQDSFWYYNEADLGFSIDPDPAETLFGCRLDEVQDPGLIQNLLTLSLGKLIKYTPQMNQAVFRYNFGVLQLYAYLNMQEHFSKALNDGAPLTLGSKGYNVLTILIKFQRRELIELLFRYLVQLSKTNRYIGHLFSVESLNELSKLVPHLLSALFTCFFVNIEDSGLPILVPMHSKLPRTKAFPNLNEILDFRSELNQINDLKTPQIQNIQYKQFLFPVNSDRLAISLLDHPDEKLFANTVVTLVLDYRWCSVRWFAGIQALVYFSFLAVLTVHALFLPENFGMLLLLFVLTACLLLYEISMCIKSRQAYLKDRWNLLDLLVIVAYLLYLVFVLSDSEAAGGLLMLFMFVAYLRGLNYFSSIDATRYMTFLLEQVVKDIIPFAILVLYVMICFSALFSLSDSDEDNHVYKYLSFLYRVSLGDFETEGFGTFKMGLFFASSFFLTITMLNLLISIVGDSFDRVQNNRVSADNIKRAIFIMEYDLFKKLWLVEKLCGKFRRKREHDKVYIAQCMKYEKFILEQWRGRQQDLKKEMHDVTHAATHESNKHLDYKMEAFATALQAQNQEMTQRVEELDDKINQILRYLSRT